MIKAIERYGPGKNFPIGPFEASYTPAANSISLADPKSHTVFALARYVGGIRWRVQFAVGGALRGNHVIFATDLWQLAGEMESQLVARAIHSGVTRGLLERGSIAQVAEDAHTYFAVRVKSPDVDPDAQGLGWAIVRGWSETDNFKRYPLATHEVRRVFFGRPMVAALKLEDMTVTEVPAKGEPKIHRGILSGPPDRTDAHRAAANRFSAAVLGSANLFQCIEPAEDFLGVVLHGAGVKPDDARRSVIWLLGVVQDAWGEREEFAGFEEFLKSRLSCNVTADGVIRGSDEPAATTDMVMTLGDFMRTDRP